MMIAELSALSEVPQPRSRQGRAGLEQSSFITNVPVHTVDLILGCPTKSAITFSVLAYEKMEGYVAYGTDSESFRNETPQQEFPEGQPVEVPIRSLLSNTRYVYQLRMHPSGAKDFTNQITGSFQSARPGGASYTFTVQADSHLDGGISPEVYCKSLTNALAAKPDFHIDLGDTFMTDKFPRYLDAASQYVVQRYFLGIIGRGAPVFLVIGNHDGETPGMGRGSNGDDMAIWSNTMRKKYFPNPLPDDFYTGNRTRHPVAGQLQNYYSWVWGDALFVVLDPFWYSAPMRRNRGDNWARSLGEEQYQWLGHTLEASKSKFKFIFIHHLVGGETPEGRGGSEASRFFEWGGQELDGRNTFDQKRPGWPLPIHELLRQHHVNIVFHGHDHLYAMQERDGIIYQEVPQPGHMRFDSLRSAEEYGYRSGVLQGSSGILRVAVSPAKTLVEYVRAYPTTAEREDRQTGNVTHQYSVKALGD